MLQLQTRFERDIPLKEWKTFRHLTLEDHPDKGRSSMSTYIDYVEDIDGDWDRFDYVTVVSTLHKGTELVGWASASILTNNIQIDVFVREDYRNKKHGQRLVQSALLKAQEHEWKPGVGYYYNELNKRFYSSLGIATPSNLI